MFVKLSRALRLASLRAARRGAAAVEFVFIAPVIILVFFGLIELSEGVNCRERMENMASTAADLVAQTTTLTNNGRDNVFGAAKAIMFPYSSDANIRISSLIVDPNNAANGKVVWSDATANVQAYPANKIIDSLPTGIITTGGSVIMSEVTFEYTSPLAHLITQPIKMSTKFYSRPRRSVTVSRIP